MSGEPPDAPAKRRFIAGAVCPSCGEMDKIVAWHDGGILHRECVRCGFRDRMADNAAVVPPTRVEPGAPAAGGEHAENASRETVQPLRFFARRPPGSTKGDA